MTTLALDTSTSQGSVAVVAGGSVIFERVFLSERRHSATVFHILQEAKAAAPPLELIAVGLGPGSYAGIRVAIAAALGLSLATGARMVGLPSVASLAPPPSRYLAIGDARRETYYATLVENGLCLEGPELLTAGELSARVAGAGCPVLASEPLPGSTLAYPSAATLALLAASGEGIAARDDLEPIYLREAYITQPKGQSAIGPAQRP